MRTPGYPRVNTVDLAAASVAEASARLRVRHVLTTDFDVYRDKSGKPLVNTLRQSGRRPA